MEYSVLWNPWLFSFCIYQDTASSCQPPFIILLRSSSVLRVKGSLQHLSQSLHGRSCERDQFGTSMSDYKTELFFFFNCNVDFFFSDCRLEFDVCFIKHCNFVAHYKGQPNIFDKSVASAFFCLLNLF